jgi:Rrf2 family protein
MLAPTTCYAAIALAELTKAPRGALPVSQIAERGGLPPAFLARVVAQMARAGLVETRRGVHGGVRLLANPLGMTMLDLCRTFSDPVIARHCLLNSAVCGHDGSCPIRAACVRQRRTLRLALQETTIADLSRARTNAAPAVQGPRLDASA